MIASRQNGYIIFFFFSATAEIKILEIQPEGKYIRLLNTSGKVYLYVLTLPLLYFKLLCHMRLYFGDLLLEKGCAVVI